jgi:hypothetical protein
MDMRRVFPYPNELFENVLDGTSFDEGMTIDLARPELDEDDNDDLGLRALYERPELVLEPSHWST